MVLVLVMLLSAIPLSAVSVSAAGGMSIAELQAKFPHGKYWNHVGNPGSSNSVNNQNGYTSSPCPKHGTVGTSSQTCNGFQPGGSQLSWQCMGYAEKLGYDATGYNPRNNANGWTTITSSSALDSLKAGDIVRYKNGNHSIYVTAVNGDTVTYTDCNRYYLCYRLTDSMSGKEWNEVSSNNYDVELIFYNPDGSVKYSNKPKNQDDSWISCFFDTAGVVLLEGLDLSKVTPGQYYLHAAPIRIAGADGAPVRAML